MLFFFFNDTATTEIYTLSYTTLFRSAAARAGEGTVPRTADGRAHGVRAPVGRAPARAGGAPCEVVGRGGAAHEAALRGLRFDFRGERLSEGLIRATKRLDSPARRPSGTNVAHPMDCARVSSRGAS